MHLVRLGVSVLALVLAGCFEPYGVAPTSSAETTTSGGTADADSTSEPTPPPGTANSTDPVTSTADGTSSPPTTTSGEPSPTTSTTSEPTSASTTDAATSDGSTGGTTMVEPECVLDAECPSGGEGQSYGLAPAASGLRSGGSVATRATREARGHRWREARPSGGEGQSYR